MNKTHRIVWSEARQGYVVAHENAAACGKPSSTRKGVVSAVAAALLALGAVQAQAASSCGVGSPALQTVSAPGETNCALAAGDSLTVTGSIADANVGVTVQAVTTGAIGVGTGASIIGGISGILVRTGGSVNGNIANSGTIQGTGSNGSGIALSNGNMTGDIVNNAVGTIHGGSEAIYIVGATLTGNINNNGGTISGASRAIVISGAAIVSSINNSNDGTIHGTISGGQNGIVLAIGSISGGLTNSGTIIGTGNRGLAIASSSNISGGITNSGLIDGAGSESIVVSSSSQVTGGLTNSGTIQGAAYGIILYGAGNIDGGITNSGTIIGGSSVGIAISSTSQVTGGLINSGTISGVSYSVRTSNGGTLDRITVTGTNTAKFIGRVRVETTPMLVATGASYTMDDGNQFTVSGFSNAGTLKIGAGNTGSITGDFINSGTFSPTVSSTSSFGKLTVIGTAYVPADMNIDVVFSDTSVCAGLATGGTVAGIISATTLSVSGTGTLTGTVSHNCATPITIAAVKNVNAVDLVASSAGPTTWIVTGASNNNSFGTVSCASASPVTNNAYATCTGTASGGYSLASAAGCGTTTVSGSTITAGPVTAACTVTGTFAASGTYAVTAVANPVAGGSVSCTPATGIAFGGSSTCSRTVNPGYTFTNWGGDCSSAGSSATCTITGITSAKSVTANFRAAAVVEVIELNVPVVPLIPPLASLPALPGVGNGGRVFLNLAEGAGPSMTGCLRTTLNDLLGPDWQYQGQSADGGGRLKRATEIISFYPIEANTNTTYGLGQGAGLYLRGANPMSVVTGCGTFVAAPALYNLGEFGAVLNADGQTAQINDQGVMTFPFGSLIYVVRPNYLVTQGTPGAPALSTGADGLLRFTDSAGHTQILYPAFLDPDLLGTQVSQAVGGWTVIQTDGTALLTLFGGQQFVLTPDLALGSVPPGTMTVWWQDGPNHYSYRNSGFSNTSQGFSVTPR